MEFHEKLQELRKSRGLTQEELAEALYVSRTAISKWESGRGYPSIDSLKEISRFFEITIDDLLSGERLLSIAEDENRANIRNMCDWLMGIVDLCSLLLILLPLYPNAVDGYIYSVNLFSYTGISGWKCFVYWILFLALIAIGMVKMIMTKLRMDRGCKITTAISMILSIFAVLFLAMSREAYAVTVVFLLLVIKVMLFFEKFLLQKGR